MPGLRNDPLVIRIGVDNYLVVSAEVVRTIEASVGANLGFTEAGGILIGSYRGSHIEIVNCTVPQPRDLRRRTLFDRKDKAHHRAAVDAWRHSGKTDTFVGEWHTHPEDHPRYSSLDRRTWDEITRRRPDPMVFCIAGWKSTWWGLGQRGTVRQLVE